eukprot:Lankesteria_metandrocarpae@DN2014_c0_g1_i1.p1
MAASLDELVHHYVLARGCSKAAKAWKKFTIKQETNSTAAVVKESVTTLVDIVDQYNKDCKLKAAHDSTTSAFVVGADDISLGSGKDEVKMNKKRQRPQSSTLDYDPNVAKAPKSKKRKTKNAEDTLDDTTLPTSATISAMPNIVQEVVNTLNTTKTKKKKKSTTVSAVQSGEAASVTTGGTDGAGDDTTTSNKAAAAADRNNQPFRRVRNEEWEDKLVTALKDNSYWNKSGDGFSQKAAGDLGQVRGKNFRHEKSKKKRASWKGCGEIDMGVNSVQFDSSDED